MVGTHAHDTCVWHSTPVKCAQDENRCIFQVANKPPAGCSGAAVLEGGGREMALHQRMELLWGSSGSQAPSTGMTRRDCSRLLCRLFFSFFGLCFLGSRFVQVHFMDVGAMSLAMGLKVCCSACLLAMELKLS